MAIKIKNAEQLAQLIMTKQNGFNFASSKKSLIETIDEVQKSSMPKSQKILALKACGLRDKEISDMLSTFVPKTSTFKRFVYTFGVEIECVHANRDELVNAGRENGVDIHSEGYNHIDNKKYFKIVHDGSVGGDVDPNEVVSPVLNGNVRGLATLKKAINSLDAVGAKVNRTCGLHVHIGVEKLTGEQYVNIFKNYQKLERLIDSFMAESRRGDCRWARSLQGYDFYNCHGVSDVVAILDRDRYRKVNPMSFERHHTVEFRQHQGSTNFEKISMWVKFCAKLVGWSRYNVFTSELNNIEDIPFLNKEEKDFFQSRKEHFAANN